MLPSLLAAVDECTDGATPDLRSYDGFSSHSDSSSSHPFLSHMDDDVWVCGTSRRSLT